MVENSGATSRAHQLRSLNRPRLITVQVEHNRPVSLRDGAHHGEVMRIQDSWRIDDEWWRNPISRRYYRLLLDNGSLRTVYHDLITDTWYAQEY